MTYGETYGEVDLAVRRLTEAGIRATTEGGWLVISLPTGELTVSAEYGASLEIDWRHDTNMTQSDGMSLET